MRYLFAGLVLTVVLGCNLALAQTGPAGCSEYLKAYRANPKSSDTNIWSLFLIGTLRLVHDKAAADGYSSLDPDAVSGNDLLSYARAYCEQHPAADFRQVMTALEVRLGELSRSAAAGPASPIKRGDFEAPADVRALAVALLPPNDNERFSGPDGYVTFRLARDRNGKVGIVPDALMLAMNDTGDPVPDYGPNPQILARVYTHSTTMDRPPSRTDDKLVEGGIPAFVIGANARDVWEIGRVKGITSVRLVSKDQLGPWEAFQSDPRNYQYYARHILEGRTAEMAFGDPGLGALASLACAGDEPGIAKALRSGANVNGTGEEGMSPLIWAVDCGNPGGVKALLDAGADPNQAKTGTTFDEKDPPTRFIIGRYSPVYLAVEKKNPAILKLLLMHGGDPNTTKDDRPGDSALVLAWRQDRDDLKLLLDADKDIGRAVPYNGSLAAQAAIAGDFETVEDLLHRGYSYELKELGRLAQNVTGPYGYVPQPQQVGARERVITLLKQRGVTFPVLDDIRISMTKNGLFVAWGNVKSWHGFTPTAARQAVLPNDPLYAELMRAAGKTMNPGDMKAIDPSAP